MSYAVFGAEVSVPESVPVVPVPGVNVSTGGVADWFFPVPSNSMPPPALPKIEFRASWPCWPVNEIPFPPLNAITFP